MAGFNTNVIATTQISEGLPRARSLVIVAIVLPTLILVWAFNGRMITLRLCVIRTLDQRNAENYIANCLNLAEYNINSVECLFVYRSLSHFGRWRH